VIPNLLSTSPRAAKPNKSAVSTVTSELGASETSTSTFCSISQSQLTTLSSEELSLFSKNSPLVTTVTWTIRNSVVDGSSTTTTRLDTSSLPREFLIESATLMDDQLTLTVLDSEAMTNSSSAPDVSQDNVSSTPQDPNLLFNNDDSNDAPYKKRKRRKWNRSAFDRPPKGKKKISSEDSNVDGVGEALAEISLSNLLVANNPASQGNDNNSVNSSESTRLPQTKCAASPTKTSLSTGLQGETRNTDVAPRLVSIEGTSALQQSVPPESVQQLSTIEQELLQSIQAVSLHCGEADTCNSSTSTTESHALQSVVNTDMLTNPIPPFIHHHSSEESLFSNEDDMLIRDALRERISNLELQSSTASSTSQSEADLMAQIVGVGLEDDRVPTVLEIENLANHFNSSLLTTSVPITLSIGLGDLHLPNNDNVETEETPSTASSVSEDNPHLCYVGDLSRSKGTEGGWIHGVP
jgi:hypothetical protein